MMKRTDLRRLRGAARKTGRLLALPAILVWALAGTAAAYDSGDVAAVLAGTGRPGADLSHADLSGADLAGYGPVADLVDDLDIDGVTRRDDIAITVSGTVF